MSKSGHVGSVDELAEVVAVERADVGEAELLEEHAGVNERRGGDAWPGADELPVARRGSCRERPLTPFARW